MRLYLALREAAHHRLFAHVPWLRGPPDGRRRVLRQRHHHRHGADRGGALGRRPDEPRSRCRTPSPPACSSRRRRRGRSTRCAGWRPCSRWWRAGSTRSSRRPPGRACRPPRRCARPYAGGAPRAGRRSRRSRASSGLELRPRRLREAAALWAALREERGTDGRDAVWGHPDLHAGQRRPRRPGGVRAALHRGARPVVAGRARRRGAVRRPGGHAGFVSGRPSGLHADALTVLRGWAPPDSGQETLRDAFVAHLEARADGMSRACRPAHVTASAAGRRARRRPGAADAAPEGGPVAADGRALRADRPQPWRRGAAGGGRGVRHRGPPAVAVPGLRGPARRRLRRRRGCARSTSTCSTSPSRRPDRSSGAAPSRSTSSGSRWTTCRQPTDAALLRLVAARVSRWCRSPAPGAPASAAAVSSPSPASLSWSTAGVVAAVAVLVRDLAVVGVRVELQPLAVAKPSR